MANVCQNVVEKCCKVSVHLQKPASVQPRTSPPKVLSRANFFDKEIIAFAPHLVPSRRGSGDKLFNSVSKLGKKGSEQSSTNEASKNHVLTWSETRLR